MKNRHESSSDHGWARKVPDLPRGYLELLQRKRYSQNTISCYTNYFRQFMVYFRETDLTKICPRQINQYILDLINYKHISASQQNQRINAIKFYYEKVLGRKREYYQLSRPRKVRKLPTVLTLEAVSYTHLTLPTKRIV